MPAVRKTEKGMSMKNKLIVLSVTIVGAVCALAPLASARSIGGWAGHPYGSTRTDAGWGCFNEIAGGVKFVGGLGCTNPGLWEMPLWVDVAGFNPNFTGTPGVACTNYVINQLGGILHSSMTATQGATDTPLFPGALSVPSGGAAFMACSLPGTNATLYTVDWP
jgi:hypothetical protein